MAHMGVQFSSFIPREQFAQRMCDHLGFEFHISTPVKAHHSYVFHQQMVGHHLWHLAAGEADGEDACFWFACAECGFEQIAANGIIDHIDTAEGFQLCAQILDAWNRHLVLRFSGQKLDDPALMKFSARFGGLTALAAAILVGLGIATGIGTFLVLTGLTPINPDDAVLTMLLIANGRGQFCSPYLKRTFLQVAMSHLEKEDLQRIMAVSGLLSINETFRFILNKPDRQSDNFCHSLAF